MKRVSLATVALAVLLATSPAAQSSGSALRHLDGIDELRSWFNAGQGHPRLIFLLSPT
jgi:hypothetical protein